MTPPLVYRPRPSASRRAFESCAEGYCLSGQSLTGLPVHAPELTRQAGGGVREFKNESQPEGAPLRATAATILAPLPAVEDAAA